MDRSNPVIGFETTKGYALNVYREGDKYLVDFKHPKISWQGVMTNEQLCSAILNGLPNVLEDIENGRWIEHG